MNNITFTENGILQFPDLHDWTLIGFRLEGTTLSLFVVSEDETRSGVLTVRSVIPGGVLTTGGPWSSIIFDIEIVTGSSAVASAQRFLRSGIDPQYSDFIPTLLECASILRVGSSIGPEVFIGLDKEIDGLITWHEDVKPAD